MFLCFFAWSRTEEGLIEEGRENGGEIWRCDVRDEPWDQFGTGKDGRYGLLRKFLVGGFSFLDLLKNHLRGVWCVRHEEVRKNEVREELEGFPRYRPWVVFTPNRVGEPRTSNPALSKTRSTLAFFKV